MISRSLRIAALTSLVLASTAVAAGSSVTATLTPDKVSSASGASITIDGPFTSSTGTTETGLPSSLSLAIQNGFTSSVKSVAVLCPPADAPKGTCPSTSQIGTGTVNVSTTIGAESVPLKLWLGAPSQAGDISTIYLYGSIAGSTLAATARLFKPSGGGLEMLIARFPPLPAEFDSFNVTIKSITFNVKAMQTGKKTVTVTTGKGKKKKKHKKTVTVVYSFLTNPSSCAGTWSATAVATYSNGSTTLPFTTPCTK